MSDLRILKLHTEQSIFLAFIVQNSRPDYLPVFMGNKENENEQHQPQQQNNNKLL